MLLAGATAAALAVAPGAVPSPQTRCTVEDPRLAELSGMVVDDPVDHGDGLWAMSDGGRRVQLLRLDPATCAVTDTRTAEIDPYDAEDLARGPRGSLWVGDIGDNERTRDTVAVIVLSARGEARLHRLTYPDGPHDAEALLVDDDGRPVIVTKDVGRPAGVYRTAEAPQGTGPTPLQRVGELTLPPSNTEGGPLGGVGSRVVTGAARSIDGGRADDGVVALRSYTDAWLYPVTGGDLVGALGGVPVRVPLPDEPQGEAIAFEPDGTLLSGSEIRGGTPGQIRAVPGAAALVTAGATATDDAPADGTAPPGPAATPPAAAPPDEPDPAWLPGAVGGGAAVAMLLLVTAVLGGRAALRRRE